MVVTIGWYVALSVILFTIGALGVLLRRNALIIFMSIELMLNSANLLLVAFAREYGDLNGQILVFFVLTVAAAEVMRILGKPGKGHAAPGAAIVSMRRQA